MPKKENVYFLVDIGGTGMKSWDSYRQDPFRNSKDVLKFYRDVNEKAWVKYGTDLRHPIPRNENRQRFGLKPLKFDDKSYTNITQAINATNFKDKSSNYISLDYAGCKGSNLLGGGEAEKAKEIAKAIIDILWKKKSYCQKNSTPLSF